MSDEYDTIPAEALKEAAYLSRSANRVEMLQTLTRGSHTRRDLTELTGASRTTLDRIVNELEERGGHGGLMMATIRRRLRVTI